MMQSVRASGSSRGSGGWSESRSLVVRVLSRVPGAAPRACNSKHACRENDVVVTTVRLGLYVACFFFFFLKENFSNNVFSLLKIITCIHHTFFALDVILFSLDHFELNNEYN
jgi:hypothetical protein